MLDTVLKIFITACLAYITINTFFRFHFSIDRILLFIFLILFVGSILYLDTEKDFEVILTTGLIVILYVVLKLVSIKKKKHGYFFFNIYQKDYKELNQIIKDTADEFNISTEKINHCVCKPWLVVIKDEDLKTTTKFIKKIDSIYTKKPKRITMYNYWFVVGFFVLIAILWRF